MERDASQSGDSDGYSPGTDGYRSGDEEPVRARYRERPASYWRKFGVESEDEFWQSLGAKPAGPPETDTPECGVPEKGRTQSPYVRQVNVKLSPETYAGLQRLGEDYGVAPSTMARMLVARGVQLASGA